MLTEGTRKDVQEIATIMMKLDNIGRTIMMSNATVLLARQEMTENRQQSCQNWRCDRSEKDGVKC